MIARSAFVAGALSIFMLQPAFAQRVVATGLGLQAYPCNQYDESPKASFLRDEELAKAGDVDAAFWVGLAYLQGCGTAQDFVMAESWLAKGAKDPSQKAQVAGIYRRGRGVPRDAAKAVHWYEMAGDSSSLFEVARIYQTGEGLQLDVARAAGIYVALLKKTNDPYLRRAQMELGNLVIDGLYASGDPRLDLSWARAIAQELIGQEQYKLGFSSQGSAMDLPATPEVHALVVRTAASYNVDLAQWQMAEGAIAMTRPEAYAWLKLAGEKQIGFSQMAARMKPSFTPEETQSAAKELEALEQTRLERGAYYRMDDPLRAATVADIESELAIYGDPDRQLRLAYAYERTASDPVAVRRAMDLYRAVRDQRVSVVRLKIGTEYLLGRDGFPKSPQTAAKWYGFAAKGGSVEACTHLAQLAAQGISSGDAVAVGVCRARGVK